MDNREEIMRCALELFHARGYDAVGVQEIVNAAGVTKPTLYYYFGSKKGLLEQILKSRYKILQGKLEEALQEGGNIPALLNRIAGVYCDFAVENRECYLLMLALFYSGRQSEGYQAVQPIIRSYYQKIISVFDHASQELGNMNGRQEQFAAGFIGTLDHFLLMQLGEVGSGKESWKEEIKEEKIYGIVHQFMYGIYS